MPGALNHFECYEAHHPPIKIPVTLSDSFGDRAANVRDPKRICNPADKNDEDATAPDDAAHLVAYKLSNVSPRFHRVRDQVVTNQFGTITVDLIRPEMLLVPSAKSLSGPPTPLVANTLDHFVCYRTGGGRTRVKGVKIDDEFGSITVDVKRPDRLCVPVSKNGEPIPDPVGHLMCYEVRLTGGAFAPAGTVFVNNQFGDDQVTSFRTRELCVPSFVNLQPAVCGDGNVDQGEDCDDGNLVDGDACEADCTLPACGNGIVDLGETCDDGNLVNGDACEADCTLPACGNGIVDLGETCDDGNLVDGDACEADCTLPACGNGIIDQGEDCDGNELGICAACTIDCACGE